MPFLAIGLKLLGIGKTIFGFILAVIKWIADFAQKHPLLFIAICIDLVLLYGCYWGYKQHNLAEDRQVKITELKREIKDKDSTIELLYKRVKEYAKALQDSQNGRVRDIQEHNKAVENLRRVADEQIRKAQEEAARTRAQRDAYMKLSEKYRNPGPNCGTPEQRIACEQKINREFIQDIQKVKR